jgi:hypothetical protein
MRIEDLKFCWLDLGDGKVCERMAAHDGECSSDPTVDLPVASQVRTPDLLAHLASLGVDPLSPTYDPSGASPTWTCRHCNRTSHNPNDALYRYCGACDHFCDDV